MTQYFIFNMADTLSNFSGISKYSNANRIKSKIKLSKIVCNVRKASINRVERHREVVSL